MSTQKLPINCRQYDTLLADFFPITECTDADGDGYKVEGGSCGPVDCNDSDPAVYPGATEICDNKDNNCNELTDENLSWDADGDSHFTPSSCQQPADDCEDNDPAVYPGAPEICDDRKDNDCDGETDEGCCDLKIDSFTGTNTEIRRDTGGPVSFRGTISDSSGKTIYWDIWAFDFHFAGTGKSPSVMWNGKGSNGKVVGIGSHTASLRAKRVDKPDCNDGKRKIFTVTESSKNACMLKVAFGSAANVAGGELGDSLSLFPVPGTLGIDLNLRYRSQDGYAGPLGIGWHHSLDVFLQENDFGEVILTEESGGYLLYQPNGDGTYRSQPGDDATLVKNADGSFLLTRKDGTKYAFNDSGKLAAITDRNGNALTFVYANGLLQKVTDSAGRSVAFNYDASGKLASITDPAGQVYRFVIGESLTSVTFPDGAVWQYTYADNAFLIARTDPLGYLTTYAYDAEHRVISSTDPEGRTRTIGYPESDDTVRTTLFTEKDGGVWQYAYDTQAGNLLAKTDPEGNVTRYTYDQNHNQLTKTDASGTTAYTYDAAGNMTSITDVAGQTTSYTYNAFGQVTSIIDPEGNVTAYEYDDKGNLTRTIDPAGATTYQYDAKGNVTKLTNPAGQSTTLAYDAAGNVTSVTDAAGSTTRFTYDTAGRLTKQIDAKGNVTSFEYDARGNLIKTVDPLGNVSTYTYDVKGNRTSEADANGRITRYAYNAQGQVTTTTDALGNVTTYAYGGAGCATCGGGADKLASLTDAKGQTTNFEYDALGRLTKETDPLGNATIYSYDAKGNLVAKTDAKGNVITYGYDVRGQLLKKSYPDGSEETFTYDAKGNLLTATNQNIGYSFVYNVAGRVTSVADNSGRIISYEYDPTGKRTKLISPDGKALRYEYDNAGRLAAILNGGNYLFAYDALGRRSTMTLPNGVVVSYGYDNAGRLTSLGHRNAAGTVVASNSYTHDKIGNRLTNAMQDRTLSYQYDAIYRLTEALSSAPGYSSNTKGKGGGIANATQQQKEFYIYDPVGNRLRTDKVASYEHNAGNEMLKAGDISFRYDRNGNLIEKIATEGTTTYEWDFENRLTKVTTPNGTIVEFKYDPFGRRIEKKATDIEGMKITRFIYDNEDILFETDETGAIGNHYIHGPGIDEPLALIQGKDTYYYHADGLGSIVALTDKAGKVVQTYEYDSFGNLKGQKNRVKQPYAYDGREYDREIMLYYNRLRYLGADSGKFISKDPIGFAGGDVNLFNFVGGNPTSWVDPYGIWQATWVSDVLSSGGGRFRDYMLTRGEVLRSSLESRITETDRLIDIRGPFGPVCGPEGSDLATWIPDTTPEACLNHDRCYDECAKNCGGVDCKLECDDKLRQCNWLYGTATERAGQGTYDGLLRGYGCGK